MRHLVSHQAKGIHHRGTEEDKTKAEKESQSTLSNPGLFVLSFLVPSLFSSAFSVSSLPLW
jgi:hypothetical protein